MGRPVDTRVIEYAYLAEMSVMLNAMKQLPPVMQNGRMVQQASALDHVVNLKYDLKDSGRNLLGTRTVQHTVLVGETPDTVVAANAKIATALPGWVLADKGMLAGYVPAPAPVTPPNPTPVPAPHA